MLQILIPEEIPSLNKGEAAILNGMLEEFKRIGLSSNIHLFSFDCEADRSRYGSSVNIVSARGIMPECSMFMSKDRINASLEYLICIGKHLVFTVLYKITGARIARTFMKREIWGVYANTDILLVGHDSAFNAIFHIMLIFMFKALKKKVVILGATFPFISRGSGLIGKMLYRHLFRLALEQCDLVTVREGISFRFLKEIGLSRNIFHLTGDFAFFVRPAADEDVQRILKDEGIDCTRPIVGCTCSRNKVRESFPAIADHADKENRFIEVFGRLVDHMVEAYNVTVVFVPHCILNDNERDDRLISGRIAEGVKNTSRVKVIEREYSAEQLRGLTSHFTFCFGTRLHFIIDAITTRVPFICVTNRKDFRTHGILGETLGLEQWLYDVEDLDYSELRDLIDLAWSERELTAHFLISAIELAKAQSSQNCELFAAIIKAHLLDYRHSSNENLYERSHQPHNSLPDQPL